MKKATKTAKEAAVLLLSLLLDIIVTLVFLAATGCALVLAVLGAAKLTVLLPLLVSLGTAHTGLDFLTVGFWKRMAAMKDLAQRI